MNQESAEPSAKNSSENVKASSDGPASSIRTDSPAEPLIAIEDFFKVKLATAIVVEAHLHPKADRLLILKLKIGERTKQIVSGIRGSYSPEEMIGKTIIVADNLKPAKLRGEVSEGMLLAVTLPEGGLRLLTTDGPAPDGLSVS